MQGKKMLIYSKLVAALLIGLLVGANFIQAGVYAANEVANLTNQDEKTSEENVTFNSVIGKNKEKAGYNYSADVNSTDTKLYLSLAVKNGGYLKDITVSLEKNNYKLNTENLENGKIKNINENTLELNQVTTGKNVELEIPISLRKEEYVDAYELNKDSKVKFTATYVNIQNKEKKIEKELTLHLNWTVQKESLVGETNQEIIRYLSYNGNTMISSLVSDSLKDYILPVSKKQIRIQVPKVSEKNPKSVIVTAIDTSATNGKLDGVDFSENNYNYDAETGILTINVENSINEEGKVAWVKGTPDKFVVTYIYEEDVKEKAIKIHTESETETLVLNGQTVKANLEKKDYDLDSKIGDIATAEVTANNEAINKGYLYANKDKNDGKVETDFSVNYKINVGLAEALNEINLKEVGDFFGDVEAGNNIYNKRVSIKREELIKLLGEEGTIKVLRKDGKEIGTLNKDTLELEVNESKISFKTSKPKTEGELSIKIEKAIKGDLPYSKEQIASFDTINTKVKINTEAEGAIKLEEPTSKASIDVSNENLSTVVENQNVIINVTLERDDVTDLLYKNPALQIKLPKEVTEINVKDATLLYDNELKSTEFTVEGNVLKLKLEGTQTEYNNNSTSKGTVIRIVTDLKLDNLAPSRNAEVELSYSNENKIVSTLEESTKSIKTNINVVAPTGFVTTNTMTGFNGNMTVTSQEGAEGIGKIEVLANEVKAEIKGTIVNNLGENATGLKIIGRIPFKGNKEIDGSKDLGTTFDTKMAGQITLEGIDAEVYYSENKEADTDLQNEANGWKKEYTSNAKSYMIVATKEADGKTGVVEHGARINFSYPIIIPANVDYGNIAKSNYGVYYDNSAEEGTKQNVVLATAVGVKTAAKAEAEIQISAKDMITGENISDNGNIKEGQYITYNISIKNTSKEAIDGVKAKIELPSGSARLIIEDALEDSWYKEYYKDYVSPYTEDVGKIEAGETKTFSVNMIAGSKTETSEDNKKILRVSATANNMDGEAKQIFTGNMVEGILTALLKTTYENKNIDVGQIVENSIEITNPTNAERTNIVAKIKIPEGLKYVSDNSDGKYNDNSRELTFNIGTLKGREKKNIEISMEAVAGSNNENLQSKIAVTCSETKDTIYSNTVTVYFGKPHVEAKLSSNVSGNILDSDTLEYYIDLKNTGKIPARVNIIDNVPAGLTSSSYKVEVSNGETVNKEYSASQIAQIIDLEAGGTARLTLVTKPVAISGGETKTVTNTPEVYILKQNSTEQLGKVDINSLTHTIEGTGGSNNVTNGKFKVTGTAWIDENQDGIKGDQEKRFSDIEVVLYDETGHIAKDANGKELITKTSAEGKYTFENLNTGKYQLVAKYNTTDYLVTTYRKENVAEAENSDFVEATLDGVPVAATDIFEIVNANHYNMDLGLKEKEKFDLKLDMNVSKVTITNPKLDTQTKEYNSNYVMVSLLNTYVEYSTVLVEYTLSVTNQGKVAGYAKELIDYLPAGMAFSSDLNNNWYLGTDGNLYTTSLANTLINPGETKNVKLVLSKKMTGENVGLVHNVAEISKDYNEYGLRDGNSTPGNKQDGENDMTAADVLLSMSTGREIASFMGITIGIIAVVAVVAFLIRKYIIRRI